MNKIFLLNSHHSIKALAWKKVLVLCWQILTGFYVNNSSVLLDIIWPGFDLFKLYIFDSGWRGYYKKNISQEKVFPYTHKIIYKNQCKQVI